MQSTIQDLIHMQPPPSMYVCATLTLQLLPLKALGGVLSLQHNPMVSYVPLNSIGLTFMKVFIAVVLKVLLRL